jgi:hypothetical protein
MLFSQVLFSVVHPTGVLPYLDPGSGSIIIQMLIAALLGVGLIVRTQWGRIKKLFGRGKPKNEEDESEE